MELLSDLILNRQTRTELINYLKNPTHALMLTGDEGVGLGEIARTLGHTIADNDMVLLEPSIHSKQKTQIINADDIADLTRLVRDRRSSSLAIVMNDVDQSAPGVFERILKIVEEPVSNVYFIFSSHEPERIPDTILSRTQSIQVLAPSVSDCDILLQGLDDLTMRQIKFVAGRKPAMMCRLCGDRQNLLAMSKQITLAKSFLSCGTAKRMQLVRDIKERDGASYFLQSLSQLMLIAVNPASSDDVMRYGRNLDLVSSVSDNIESNGNIKLQLLRLAIELA